MDVAPLSCPPESSVKTHERAGQKRTPAQGGGGGQAGVKGQARGKGALFPFDRADFSASAATGLKRNLLSLSDLAPFCAPFMASKGLCLRQGAA